MIIINTLQKTFYVPISPTEAVPILCVPGKDNVLVPKLLYVKTRVLRPVF